MRPITRAVAAFATFASLTGCAASIHAARGTVETAREQPAHLSQKNGGYYGFFWGIVRPSADHTNSGACTACAGTMSA